MTITGLKQLRFITPGVIIVLFFALFSLVTGIFSVSSLTKIQVPIISIVVFGFGLLYYITPFREASNQQYFDEVNQNLVDGLLRIAGLDNSEGRYKWSDVRRIFYPIVDKDKSLEKKSARLFQNGYAWTTAADARVISAFFALGSWLYFCVKYVISGFNSGIWATLMFVVIYLITVPISRFLTDRHKKLGDEQLEIIEQYYRDELRNELVGMSGSGS